MKENPTEKAKENRNDTGVIDPISWLGYGEKKKKEQNEREILYSRRHGRHQLGPSNIIKLRKTLVEKACINQTAQ